MSLGDLERAALDALDVGVLVLDRRSSRVLLQNDYALRQVGAPLPEQLLDTAREMLAAFQKTGHRPSAVRLELSQRAVYLKVQPLPEQTFDVLLVRAEVLRDVEAFQWLNSHHHVSRREFQVLNGLRLGKTNRQLGHELGLAEGTVRRHVERLRERFEVHNRTRLVALVDQLLAQVRKE